MQKVTIWAFIWQHVSYVIVGYHSNNIQEWKRSPFEHSSDNMLVMLSLHIIPTMFKNAKGHHLSIHLTTYWSCYRCISFQQYIRIKKVTIWAFIWQHVSHVMVAYHSNNFQECKRSPFEHSSDNMLVMLLLDTIPTIYKNEKGHHLSIHLTTC